MERASENADRLLFIVSQKDNKRDEITSEDLYTVGVVARVRQISKLPGGTIRVHADGLYRAKISEFFKKFFVVRFLEHISIYNKL